MKKLITLFLLFGYLSGYAQQKFNLSVTESQIFWKGTPAFGYGGHEGTLKFSSGNMIVSNDGKIQGGTFVIDMNSIKNTDQKDLKGQRNLEEHLKADDFFAVGKYPQANFIIAKVQPTAQPNKYSITGNFIMKGISNQIVFTAFININKDNVVAKGDLSIYRSRWGITYKTPNFISTIKDDLIADEIPIKLDLVFKKI
ncbi:YceI family protein [Arcicella aquatica]|uniref:YceI family protein n=1 Tax=Arcicella aquatica TaxID=217141 RepID=A0ABU5QHF6_9BACT|nr:YceI family protein [Arcicella aquatica]MEA5256159.1 YceI family protein [Arcicella aquatica]